MDWINHLIEAGLILSTIALTHATLLANNRTYAEALVSLAKRRETVSGQHSRRAVRERCADPHKHSGCDRPLPVKRHS